MKPTRSLAPALAAAALFTLPACDAEREREDGVATEGEAVGEEAEEGAEAVGQEAEEGAAEVEGAVEE